MQWQCLSFMQCPLPGGILTGDESAFVCIYKRLLEKNESPMLVAQLAEKSLPIPKVCGSCRTNGNILYWIYLLLTFEKNKTYKSAKYEVEFRTAFLHKDFETSLAVGKIYFKYPPAVREQLSCVSERSESNQFLLKVWNENWVELLVENLQDLTYVHFMNVPSYKHLEHWQSLSRTDDHVQIQPT